MLNQLQLGPTTVANRKQPVSGSSSLVYLYFRKCETGRGPVASKKGKKTGCNRTLKLYSHWHLLRYTYGFTSLANPRSILIVWMVMAMHLGCILDLFDHILVLTISLLPDSLSYTQPPLCEWCISAQPQTPENDHPRTEHSRVGQRFLQGKLVHSRPNNQTRAMFKHPRRQCLVHHI